MAPRSRTTEEKKMPFEDKMMPVFMISVAAELADMHPQTLRMYERRGLIRPRRSSKSTRLYSLADVERLRRIQQLVAECGLNLAGVERVLQMEEQLDTLQRRVDQMQADMDRLVAQARDELEAVHRSYRKELVPVSSPGQIILVTDQRRAKR
jgi:MerR family transcriptional regulator, heat shock protein HspR